MKKTMLRSWVAALGLMSSMAAHAHFQLVYTPEVNLENPANVPVKLVFWHPMENGHVMDMGKPESFFVVHKDQKTDLMPLLKPITFKGLENSAKAFEVSVPVRRNGDYIFVLKPAPYFEKEEEIYIQQITKSYVNKSGIPSGWEKPVGLPTEIVPLNKPTNVVVGSTFSGQVLSNGKPVEGAEIEIEYMAAPPDVKKNAPVSKASLGAKGGSIVAITDSNGVFTFGIPKAGFWGFAALGSGPEKTYQGKELSQDAVIWIRADALK